MDFGEKFEGKLNKMIKKYGLREKPIIRENINSQETEEIEDTRNYNYYFHYEKRKDEIFALSEDLQIQKEKNNKHEYYVIFFDQEIALSLKKISKNPDMFKNPPDISVEDLFFSIHNLRIKYNTEKFNNFEVKRILNFTEELFQDQYQKMDNMIKAGVIDFNSLWYYLDKINTIYVVRHLEEEICFKYKQFVKFFDNKDETLLLIGNIIVPSSGSLNVYELEYKIKKFTGTKKLDTLKINILKNEDKEKYLVYGKKIIDCYKEIKHMYLDGKHYIKNNKDFIAYERHERVIIDYEGMLRYSTSPFNFDLKKTIELENLTENEKIIIFPFACIFNLGINKNWGITHINNLKEIVYQKDAFEHLVLEPDKKSIIKVLIKNKAKSEKLKDFIETKGNGLIFLLYGAPGTGKTLSAEATCEFLERPLYSINVGDLGTEPENMEIIINSVFEYSKRWNAIVVMDEVDIFLEERENNMIARNAMVGVFLKLLEYHNGIIFLTTNRLTSLDPAVKSRINLMISYKDLTPERRLKIWKSLFEKWNISVANKTLETLSEYKLNGREIRNYIKIIIAIHEEQNKEITDISLIGELENCFKIADEFNIILNNNSQLYT